MSRKPVIPSNVSAKCTEKSTFQELWADRKGRVRSWTEQVEVPCNSTRAEQPVQQPVTRGPADDNSCIEGAVLGGLVGAAGGAALSRDEGNCIGIPLGIVGGALVGCQIAGG